MLKIRCSSLSSIMTKPKEKGQILSVGAKTYIQGLAKQHVYGYNKEINTKEMQKGLVVEPQSIELLNEVLFTNFIKNPIQYTNDWLTGTPDIITRIKIHDIKSSWSLNTFPVTVEAGHDTKYEWQVRGYMMLRDVPEAEVDYCLVDTPEELIGFEDDGAHLVSHIDPILRVTRVPYERDRAKEEFIKFQVEQAREYYIQAVEEIYSLHS